MRSIIRNHIELDRLDIIFTRHAFLVALALGLLVAGSNARAQSVTEPLATPAPQSSLGVSSMDEVQNPSAPASRSNLTATTVVAPQSETANRKADTVVSSRAESNGSTLTSAEKKALYALPYLMRPAIAPNLVHIDGTLATHDGGTTVPTVFTAGGKPIDSAPDLGFYVREAFVYNSPDSGSSGTGLTNPLLFMLYTPEVSKNLRLAVFGGVAIPIGAGGGNDPNKDARAAMVSGVYAREAMDNALFATNYLTPTVGLGVAYIADRWTLQAECTLLELLRVRGDQVDRDPTRTNFVGSAQVGYQIIPLVTASAEFHYQHWLSTPSMVKNDDAYRSQATAGLGLRANIPLSTTTIIRPGIGYFMPLDDPMANANYRIFMLDVPVAF